MKTTQKTPLNPTHRHTHYPVKKDLKVKNHHVEAFESCPVHAWSPNLCVPTELDSCGGFAVPPSSIQDLRPTVRLKHRCMHHSARAQCRWLRADAFLAENITEHC